MPGYCNEQLAKIMLLVVALCATARGALTFNFSPNPGTPQAVQDGFAAAGSLWSAALSDDVAIHLTIDYQPLGAGVLGSASSIKQAFTYTDVRTALLADAKSANDATATSHLPGGGALDMLINYTNNSPFGMGSATPYLDNNGDGNNSTIRMTLGDAKALGLVDPHDPASSGTITFSSNFAWDFDRSNGITAGQYDFVGVAAHELGHMLGFVSGVDILDINSPNGGTYYNDNIFTYVSTPDIFRFSASSRAQGSGVIDWTADARNKYFSIDGGTTSVAPFSTGTTHGDGNQDSHWKDSMGLGIMDPTVASGELMAISNTDLELMDVIGWDLSGGGSAVPEPAFLGLLGPIVLACHLVGRRPLRKARRSAI
jgi:hypothetical protein